MKKVVLLFLVFISFYTVYSQENKKHQFQFSSEKIDNVLLDIETKFNIKYSYVDSVLVKKSITLPKKKYSLAEINSKIELQTDLKIVKIDNRFYSVIYENAEKIKTYQLEEILIEGFLTKGINKTNQKYILYPQKIEMLPGVTDADILLSLQQLPGVKSPNETATGLHIRGGTSDQNLVVYDGIRLYHSGHLFGMISGINPNVEQTVNYYNKATNPKFGERISSVIDIKSSDKIAKNSKINAGINALNADLYVQMPIYKEKLGLQISGRKSFTEWLQTPTFNKLAEKVFQNTNFNDFNNQNKFEFQDFSAKLNYKPNSKTEISITSLFIDNNLDYKNETEDNSITNQKMKIQNYGFSLNWTQKYSEKFTQKTLLFYSLYDFNYLKNQEFNTNDFEAFKKLNRAIDSGMELNFSYVFNKKLNLDFGYQLFGNDVSHLFNTYNQDIGIDLSLKHLYSISHIGYSNLKFEINKWNFHLGTRYNSFNKIKSNSIEPRVFIQKRFSDSFILQTTFESKSQILSQVRENNTNDLSLENYVWVLAENNEYPIQKANQITTGFILKNKNWLLDIDAYYKTINGITTNTFGFFNQNDAQIYYGNGFTKGIDFLLQKSAKTWRTWFTYTYQDSQNKYNDLNSNQYFNANASITHALNISLNKKWNNYSLALGWFWHTGKPYSLLNNLDQVTSFNTEKLPSYHRLDISGIYQFHSKKTNSYKIGFSIYNAYNNKSIISKEFERKFTNFNDFINTRYVTKNYYSLGFTPNVFVRMSF